MKKIKILFFGKLKESWKTPKFTHHTECDSIESLYSQLLNSSLNRPHKPSIKVAINDEFVQWDSAIKDGDTIAFLPPASGG